MAEDLKDIKKPEFLKYFINEVLEKYKSNIFMSSKDWASMREEIFYLIDLASKKKD